MKTKKLNELDIGDKVLVCDKQEFISIETIQTITSRTSSPTHFSISFNTNKNNHCWSGLLNQEILIQ